MLIFDIITPPPSHHHPLNTIVLPGRFCIQNHKVNLKFYRILVLEINLADNIFIRNVM